MIPPPQITSWKDWAEIGLGFALASFLIGFLSAATRDALNHWRASRRRRPIHDYGWIDPVKDAQASAIAVANGLSQSKSPPAVEEAPAPRARPDGVKWPAGMGTGIAALQKSRSAELLQRVRFVRFRTTRTDGHPVVVLEGKRDIFDDSPWEKISAVPPEEQHRNVNEYAASLWADNRRETR